MEDIICSTKKKPYNLIIDASYQFGIQIFRGTSVPEHKFKKLYLSLGPVIYFNSSVGLEFLMGYGYNYDINTIRGDELMASGLQMGIGLQIHLKK